MDLRCEFVLRAKGPGANVAELCREYGISRKTGYKWLARFDAAGADGLKEMSRRPRRVVRVSGDVVLRIGELRALHPKWGPKKLRVLLRRAGVSEVPSVKTIARILERLGAARVRRPRRTGTSVDRAAPKLEVLAPNDVWTVDFKGWWHAGNGEVCNPLTVRDAFSRFVLCVKLTDKTSREEVQPTFEALFQRWGLPRVIHVDNGSPFGCTRALGGLTKLSAWWISLGIKVSFSRPASPQDNGGHERMHGDMQKEIADNASDSRAGQQRVCDAWVEEFNNVRPHEAIEMRTPAELYKRSPRVYRGARSFRWRIGLDIRTVRQNGTIRWNGAVVFISAALVGHSVAVEPVGDDFVRITFYELELGLVTHSRGSARERPSKPAQARDRAKTK